MSENLTLQLSKIIKASRSRTFEAWTRPEDLLHWFAPGPMKATTIDVDLTVGGVFRWAMQGPSSRSGEMTQVVYIGVFQEIVPDQLLKFSWQPEGNPSEDTLVTVTFADVEGGTEVMLTHEHIPSTDIYNRNKMGWGSMLDKLCGLIERVAASVQ